VGLTLPWNIYTRNIAIRLLSKIREGHFTLENLHKHTYISRVSSVSRVSKVGRVSRVSRVSRVRRVSRVSTSRVSREE
jgi:hypothetical protein